MSGIWRLRGGNPLDGSVAVQGSKNSVLPLMAAAVLARRSVRLTGVPQLSDVREMAAILGELKMPAAVQEDTLVIDPRTMGEPCIGASHMGTLRASILFLGALLARVGECRMALPGGCDLGPRPVDLHIQGLTAMGARICIADGELRAEVPGGLHGAVIRLPFPSVGATENLLLAAVTAKGDTCVKNAAREPEIRDLVLFLRQMGGEIADDGRGMLEIHGLGCREALSDASMTVQIAPDRIAAGTYLCAAAATGGCVTVTGLESEPLMPLLQILQESGCMVQMRRDSITLSGRPTRPVHVETAPYPGFPTDLQAPLMAAMLRTPGESSFCESVFPDRFRHVSALRALGAWIETERRQAAVRGVPKLHGAAMTATDLRGGAAMVLAALAAEGESCLSRTELIERGYEAMPQILKSLGASIETQ